MTDYLEIINYLDEASRRLNEAMSSISHAKISLESKHVKAYSISDNNHIRKGK